jgi:hypothetical protein
MKLSTHIAILEHFKALPPQTITRKSLSLLLSRHRAEWKAPKSLGVDELINVLLENDQLKVAELSSTEYGTKQRYILGTPSAFQVGTSFYKNSFLSHGTALYIHGLAPPGPIYVNHEQSAKVSHSKLTQTGLDRAFRNKQRLSNYVFNFADETIVFLNGKHTDNAGVIEMLGPNGERLRVTNLERTLIDITVRPRYVENMELVESAFAKAVTQVSIEEIADLLKRIDYAYPYQQALGFRLQRAGIAENLLAPLKSQTMRFKFYLDYGMADPEYDPTWKIYYPRNLR